MLKIKDKIPSFSKKSIQDKDLMIKTVKNMVTKIASK